MSKTRISVIRIASAYLPFFILMSTTSSVLAENAVSQKKQVFATVTSEMHLFSTNNQREYLQLFIANALVLDGSAPFEFKGIPAIAGWFERSHAGLYSVTIIPGDPADIEIAKGRAFAVVPFTFTGTGPKGKTFTAKGYLTAVLVHVRARWRIKYMAASVTG